MPPRLPCPTTTHAGARLLLLDPPGRWLVGRRRRSTGTGPLSVLVGLAPGQRRPFLDGRSLGSVASPAPDPDHPATPPSVASPAPAPWTTTTTTTTQLPRTRTLDTPQPRQRVLWYSDPRNLDAQVQAMLSMGRTGEAVELLEQHGGLGVYGAICEHLLTRLRERGEHALVLRTYRLMLSQQVPLDPLTITMALDSLAALAGAPGCDNAQRAGHLEEAHAILARAEAGSNVTSLIHHNVLLKVCKACVDAGGLEAAQGLYARMPERDALTFTSMLQMTAKSANGKKFALVRRLYRDLRTSPVPMDSYLLAALLLNCNRYRSAASVEFGHALLRRHLSFPRSPDTPANRDQWSSAPATQAIPMALPLLLSCVQFLSLSLTPMLAHRFALQHLDTPGLCAGPNDWNFQVWRILLSLLIHQEAYEEAWELVTDPLPAAYKYEASLRLAAAALWRNQRLGREQANALWLARAAAYDGLRPARASISLLMSYVRVAMANPAVHPDQTTIFLAQHYFQDIRESGRRMASLLIHGKRPDGSFTLTRHQAIEASEAIQFFTLVAEHLRNAEELGASSSRTGAAAPPAPVLQPAQQEKILVLQTFVWRIISILDSLPSTLLTELERHFTRAPA